MIRKVFQTCLLGAVILGAPVSASSDRPDEINALLDALKIAETIEIMQLEGADYGKSLHEEMMLDSDPEQWDRTVASIYDGDKMFTLIANSFKAELDQSDLGPILEYYQSEDGVEIVTLEIGARHAFLDPDVEALAAETYASLAEAEDPFVDQIETLIKDSDLIEANVAGALNSEMMFYRGLIDGGAFEVSEEEMLSDIWAGEEGMRDSTRDWLQSFLTMAYKPLRTEQLDDYAAFYRTPEGKELNRVLFIAFDQMYDEISYLLGIAVAKEMMSERL